MTQADYAALAGRPNGVQAGTASSALANKTWRQGANMAAMLGKFISDHGYDALDNGDVPALEVNYELALSEFVDALITAGATPFATLAEVRAGTVTGKAVDPAKLATLMQGGDNTYIAGGGSANAITATLVPAPSAYKEGMEFRVKLSTTNTSTSVTLNLNSLGAKTIKRIDGTNPAIGYLASGQIHTFIYDGTNLVDTTPVFGSASLSGSGYYRFPDGLTMQWGTYSSTGGSGTVTFPIAFSGGPYSVLAIDGGASGWSTSNATFLGYASGNATTATFKYVNWNGSAFVTSNCFIQWFAIGPT
ncbi:gp53-like domain-containing protein [Kaistia algarum]|uniref:gp53-like domain-containing protein n=1 Tax=Kaistia algarum TaxID=2083279 RepID=UPI0022511AE6|nr:hypothetical protein [Kaistia algarum]MCX5516245.1 hypothetical protein [Kaistia algarum]